MDEVVKRAEKFIYRNARPLDLARWKYHFEDGDRNDVLRALSYYQNADGGFGHALEPDSWNPESTPLQTWTATEILREAGLVDGSHPIIRGIIKYLGSGADFDGHFWANTVKSNNDHPHAPWWHHNGDENQSGSYNPTACLAGFIIRYADKNTGIYDTGKRIAREAFEFYRETDLLDDMHTSLCFVRLMQYVKEAGHSDIFDLDEFTEKLKKQVSHNITMDTKKWDSSYICKPSQFFNSTDNIFYEDNREIADFECGFIRRTQLEDGSWNITWSWPEYPEARAVTKNRWKSIGAILNVLYLKGMCHGHR